MSRSAESRPAIPTAQVPAAGPASAFEAPSPLSEADFQTLHHALLAYRPLRTAARTAFISASVTLALAVLSVPFALLSPGLIHLLVTVGLAIIGYREYTGARKMRQGVPQAATHLGWNQVIFMAIICAYCVSRLLGAEDYLPAASRSQLSQVPELAGQLDALIPAIIRGFYLLVMAVSILGQGGFAWYYFSRRRHLENLQRSVPTWVRRIMNEMA